MSWEHFIWFAIAALICWSLGAFAAWKGKKPVWTYGFTLLGLVIFFSFILGMWISLERPPMYNRQIKKFPTEKQNVSLKHILT